MLVGMLTNVCVYTHAHAWNTSVKISGETGLRSKCWRQPDLKKRHGKGGFLGARSQHKGSWPISERWSESLPLRGGLARRVLMV